MSANKSIFISTLAIASVLVLTTPLVGGQSRLTPIPSSYDYVGPDGHKFHVTVVNGQPRQIADSNGIVIAFVDSSGGIHKTGQGDATGLDEAIAAARAGVPSAVSGASGPKPSTPQGYAPQGSTVPAATQQPANVETPQISLDAAGDVTVIQNGSTVVYTHDGTIELKDAMGGTVELHYTGNSAAQRAKQASKAVFIGAVTLGGRNTGLHTGDSWEFKKNNVVFYELGGMTTETITQAAREGEYKELAKQGVKNAQAAVDFAAANGKPLTAIATGLPSLQAFCQN